MAGAGKKPLHGPLHLRPLNEAGAAEDLRLASRLFTPVFGPASLERVTHEHRSGSKSHNKTQVYWGQFLLEIRPSICDREISRAQDHRACSKYSSITGKVAFSLSVLHKKSRCS